MADLTPQIAQAGAGPQSARTDMGSATQFPIEQLIKADAYLKAAAASALPARGLRFTKLIGPPQCPAQFPTPDLPPAGSFS